jgi:tol-pal system protein YbgF
MRSHFVGLAILLTVGWADARAAVDPAQASYDTAFGLTRARSFDQAEVAWQNFLRQYPDHPLDGSAQYFLGETYFARNDFQRAAAAFAAGIVRYPKGDFAAETLLKLGIALGRAGQSAPACDAFSRLDRDFPDVTGVVRERAFVEKRFYHCPEPVAAVTPASLRSDDSGARVPGSTSLGSTSLGSTSLGASFPGARSAGEAATAPRPTPAQAESPLIAPEPHPAAAAKIVASLEHASDGEPAPPAQPVIPVERQKLPMATDEERAAARAELYVTPPPSVSAKSGHSARAAGTGPSGDAVKTAQILLAALDFDPGPVNGQAGSKLHDAVRAFQAKDGMRSDGEVNDRLLERLSFALVTHRSALPRAAEQNRVAGTGLIVSRSGFVLTSYRLVAGCSDLRVAVAGAEGAAAPLIASDPGNDLALLRVKATLAAAAIFHDGRGPREGDGIVVTGMTPSQAEAANFYISAGTVSALTGARSDHASLKISAAVEGERGVAPVFDRAGQVVGVLGTAAPEKGKKPTAPQASDTALRATIAENFLDAHNVDYESARSTGDATAGDATSGDLKASAIGDMAKSVVVLVECHR